MLQRDVNCKFSTTALLHNTAVIKAQAPDSKIMAMVKSDGYGYGHGMLAVAQRLEGHVDALGVASFDEAIALHEAGIKTPVALVYGVYSREEMRLAFEKGFILSFHNKEQIAWLKELEQLNIKFPNKMQAFLGIDTGMGREGFLPEKAEEPLTALANSPLIDCPVGIQSHFSCADDPESEQNKKQIAAFRAFTEKHPEAVESLCNSAAIFAFPEAHKGKAGWVRPGIALYGVSPFDNRSAESLGLKPVMTLQSRLVEIHDEKKGKPLSYGVKFACPEDMRVGKIPVGYGDGYLHAGSLQETRSVLINGKPCPVVGAISMDAILVDLRSCPEAAINDTVTLWGEGLPLNSVANAINMIPYVFLTGVAHGTRTAMTWQDELTPNAVAKAGRKYMNSMFRQNAFAMLSREGPDENWAVFSDLVSIRGVPKDILFAALYNRAKSLNHSAYFDLKDYSFSAPMTAELARKIIKERGLCFNAEPEARASGEARQATVGDRHLHFILKGNILYTRSYDTRNGPGAAASVLRAIRAGMPPPENKDNAQAIELYHERLCESMNKLFIAEAQNDNTSYHFVAGLFLAKEGLPEGFSDRFIEALNGTMKAYALINARRMTLGGIEKAFLDQVEALLDCKGPSCKTGLLALYDICGKDFLRTAAVISAWNRKEEDAFDFAWTKKLDLKTCLNILESGPRVADIRNAVEACFDSGEPNLGPVDIDAIIHKAQFKIPESQDVMPCAGSRSRGMRKKEKALSWL